MKMEGMELRVRRKPEEELKRKKYKKCTQKTRFW
jgi:hypothetical protein